jgi:hypothetical protein
MLWVTDKTIKKTFSETAFYSVSDFFITFETPFQNCLNPLNTQNRHAILKAFQGKPSPARRGAGNHKFRILDFIFSF